MLAGRRAGHLDYCNGGSEVAILTFHLQGWRWTWIISGIPGIVLAAVILITVREPVRSVDDTADAQSEQTTETQPGVSWQHTVGQVCKTFFQPSSLMLCLAGSIRNAGENAPL